LFPTSYPLIFPRPGTSFGWLSSLRWIGCYLRWSQFPSYSTPPLRSGRPFTLGVVAQLRGFRPSDTRLRWRFLLCSSFSCFHQHLPPRRHPNPYFNLSVKAPCPTDSLFFPLALPCHVVGTPSRLQHLFSPTLCSNASQLSPLFRVPSLPGRGSNR